MTSNPSALQLASPPPTPTPPPRRPGRIPRTTTLDVAMKYWEEGDQRKGLLTPLCDWPKYFEPAEYRRESQKRIQIKMVCHDEYIVDCGRDRAVMEARYPGLLDSYTNLMHQVRRRRQADGKIATRTRRTNTDNAVVEEEAILEDDEDEDQQ